MVERHCKVTIGHNPSGTVVRGEVLRAVWVPRGVAPSRPAVEQQSARRQLGHADLVALESIRSVVGFPVRVRVPHARVVVLSVAGEEKAAGAALNLGARRFRLHFNRPVRVAAVELVCDVSYAAPRQTYDAFPLKSFQIVYE